MRGEEGEAGGRLEAAELLERLLAGERLAFLQFNRMVTGFLIHLRAYDFQEEWDDLRQDVLASVLANARAGRLRDPRAFVAYTRTVTRNRFLDRLRRRLGHGEKEMLPWDEETARIAGPPPGPDAEARALWRAVDELPEPQRRAVEGVYREGHSVQEVSRATGVPVGTLKRRLRQSLARLRERLAEGEPSGA